MSTFRWIPIALLLATAAHAQSSPVRINEVLTANLSGIQDEYEPGLDNCRERNCTAYYEVLGNSPFATYDGDYPDWIELYNPGGTAVNLAGYGISDNPAEPFKWVFPGYTIPAQGYFVVLATGKDRKPDISGSTFSTWETLITAGDEWRYFPGPGSVPSGWYRSNYDDSGWTAGPSGFGFGDGDDRTEFPTSTVSCMIRKTFTIENVGDIASLVLHMDYDDGFVAYLNGTRIVTVNMTWRGLPPGRNDFAEASHEAVLYTGGVPEMFVLDTSIPLLISGVNVLAVQVHNSSATSDDLTVIPFLSVQYRTSTGAGIAPEIASSILRDDLYPHTNFKLGSGGVQVVLTEPSGARADLLEAGPLPADFSFGRQPDGSETAEVFHSPTPKAANTTLPFTGFVDDPLTILPQGGFYSGNISVTMAAGSPDAAIYYTLDGSDPTPLSTRYTGPVTRTLSTSVRARAYRNDIPSSQTITQTYFLNYVPTMPVISITTPPKNLWDPDIGIYVEGRNGSGHYSNLFRDWERPCHIELYEADGTLGFSCDAGVRLHGRASKFNARKGLAIFTRDKYGTDEIDYPLIPELPLRTYESFLIYGGGSADWQGSLIRDMLAQDLVKDLNIDSMGGRPAVLFLNGQYWGIQPIREKENEDYLAAHHNVDPDNIDLMELYHGFREVVPPIGIEGTEDNYNAMVAFLENNDIRDPAVYAQVKDIIDIDSYLDHHVAQVYYTNTDWLGNNYKCWRDRGPDGRWRFLMFDVDFAFHGSGDHTVNMIDFITNPNGPKAAYPPWTNFIIRTLLQNDEFKNDFINRFADLCNTVFEPSHILERVEVLKAEFAPEIPRHIQRWSTTSLNSMSIWESELNEIRTFAQNRIPYARNHIIQYWGLSGTATVTLSVNDPAAGDIRISTVVPDAYPWQGTYFRDVPVTITALPRPGYAFEGWDGLEGAAKATGWSSVLTLTLPVATTLTARFQPSSDAVNRVIVTEIAYGPAGDSDPGDWIELYNGFESPVDVSGWELRDDDDTRSFVMPVHTIIEPGGFLVVSEQPSAFRPVFPGTGGIVGGFAFGFGSEGDSIRLFDSRQRLVDVVTYTDGYPWPGAAGARVIGLRTVGLDNGLPASWAVEADGGSPGVPNTFPLSIPVVINEICYNPPEDHQSGDWVELHNNLAEPVNLSGWVFRDGDDAHTFVIPSGTVIPSQGYRVLCREAAQFGSVFPDVSGTVGDFGFGLSNGGDLLRLFDAEGTLVDWIEYDDSDPWPVEPDGGGSTLALLNPNLDNGSCLNWTASDGYGTPGEQNDAYTGIGDPDDRPAAFSLGQNYPNPFNAGTTIPFAVATSARATLTVYNLTGQAVCTLMDRNLSPGTYTVAWNGRDDDGGAVSSGVYLVRLTSGESVQVKRLLLLK